jgi:hypothetical protein
MMQAVLVFPEPTAAIVRVSAIVSRRAYRRAARVGHGVADQADWGAAVKAAMLHEDRSGLEFVRARSAGAAAVFLRWRVFGSFGPRRGRS